MKRDSADNDDDMLDEYEFRGGVRGKYAERFARQSIVVVLDPDVAEVFHTTEAVNDALRSLAGLINAHNRRVSSLDGTGPLDMV